MGLVPAFWSLRALAVRAAGLVPDGTPFTAAVAVCAFTAGVVRLVGGTVNLLVDTTEADG